MDLEEKRLQALQQYDILDSGKKEAFDNLAKLASRICGTSSAQINFLDENRQWTKANIGWGQKEIPRDISFCNHTIQSKDPFLVVQDTYKDQRFKDNPLTKKDPPLRFYAGVTIRSIDNYPLGTLCVFDSQPKELSEHQLEALQILADEVETHLKLRLNRNQLKETLVQENKFNKKIISSLPLNFFMYNSEGEMVRWNEYMKSVTGYSNEEIKQRNPEDYFDESEAQKVKSKMEEVFKGEQVSFEANLIKKDGSSAPYLFSASGFDMNGETFLIGTGQDITEQKETQHQLEQSLEEKESLLSEIHHRVKNNLAVISGLVELEALDSEYAETDKKLKNIKLRIRSMALIHEIMYKTESFNRVVFDNVIQAIAQNIKNTYRNAANVSILIETEEITLNVNQAIPFGLIINELLTNAWKHAYQDDEEGVINVEMSKMEETIALRIADQGVGLPENAGPTKSKTLGFTLVKQLCNQLNADLKVNRGQGTEYLIEFAKSEVKGSASGL